MCLFYILTVCLGIGAYVSRPYDFTIYITISEKKVGKAPNCYVGISPKGKNVKFLLVTLHVGTSPKFCVKLEYLRKGKNILFMSLTLHVGTSPNCDMTLLT